MYPISNYKYTKNLTDKQGYFYFISAERCFFKKLVINLLRKHQIKEDLDMWVGI